MLRITQDAYTFDDVLLLPAHSNVLPKDAKLNTLLTKSIHLNIPLLSAAMDTVTESKLAIALAQEGGMGIIHKNMNIEQQASEVRKVKKFENGIVLDPITINSQKTVRELLQLTAQHNISGVPVVDNEKLVGIVTHRDLRFETNLDQPVAAIMTPKDRLITVNEGASREEMIRLMHHNRIEKVLIVNSQFALRGLVTAKDIQKAKERPGACKDSEGQLYVGAAVGTGAGTSERVTALIEAGVDLLVVDTAHGHAESVLERVRWIKKNFPDVQVMGGNIATAAAAKALVAAGADAVKVGVGPGSICITRVVTGVGVPQISAIANVAEALAGTGIPIIADGGIRYSGDICKAIAAGAHAVMIGGLFAGTDEAPGELVLYQGRTYKTYRGMGSISAMENGSSERYFQDSETNTKKLVPEGVEGRVPYKGSMQAVVHQLMGGLRAGMGYTGSATIAEMQTKAEFMKVTAAGVQEGHAHDISIVKEPPNYRTE